MGLFSGSSGAGEALIRNEDALDYSFVPKLIPYRENEQQHIATCIKPLFHGRNGRNIFVYGKPGVGKTVACRHILQELEEQTEEIVPIYINCWQHNTTFKILLEICNALDYKFTQNKRSDELFVIVKQMLNRKSAVFVLDEIDKLQDYDFIYTIIEDRYRKAIILLTNEKSWLSSLDSRIRSRLMAETLEFRPYNSEETKGILKQRIDYAFYPAAWESEAFELVARKTYEMHDIRRGLYLMKEAALCAEHRNSKRISAQDVQKALENMDDFTLGDAEAMEDDDRLMLEVVKKSSGAKIGDLYKAYQDSGGKAAYKTFQRRMDRFEKEKYVTLDKIPGGIEGKTTIVNYGGNKKITEF